MIFVLLTLLVGFGQPGVLAFALSLLVFGGVLFVVSLNLALKIPTRRLGVRAGIVALFSVLLALDGLFVLVEGLGWSSIFVAVLAIISLACVSSASARKWFSK